MYVIKMNDDKSLSATIKSTIYQGERNADTLVFLIPSVYEDKNFADCTLLLRYILPNGVGRSEELEADAELYKDYYQYRLKVSTRLTDVAGNIELWLSAVDFNDNYILKSGTTHIDVTPTKKVSDYLSDDSLDELDKMSARLSQLSATVATKADNLTYDEDKRLLQLTSDGKSVGNSVDISSAGSDEVIDVDPIDIDDIESDGADSDELITF